MKSSVTSLLVCPDCFGQLDWHIEVETAAEIEQGEARCSDCPAVYPVRDGIGIFLMPDLPRNDMWAQAESQLAAHLQQHPKLERQLMDGPVEKLAATDQLLRAMTLDERGEFGEAQEIEELARRNLYTPAFLDCWDRQTKHVLQHLASRDGPLVDLASGRGYLVEKIVKQFQRHVIATDFSLTVLRRNRAYFRFLGLDEFVTFLAFDARKTPFAKGAVRTMTTNVGLPNIQAPGELAKELGRIVNGVLFAISHFYPEDDAVNRRAIEDAGVAPFVYRDSAVRYLEESGWEVAIENECAGPAAPTPASAIFEGARADGLPVAPTELTWATIQAVSSHFLELS